MKSKMMCWLATGMAVCLMMSSCRTVYDAPIPTDEKVTEKKRDSELREEVTRKLKSIILPEISFRPPATIIDALDFFKGASRDYDDAGIPVEQRGISFSVKLPATMPEDGEDADVFTPTSSGDIPVIPTMSARNISLYDALQLVCAVTGMKFRIIGRGLVMIVPCEPDESDFVKRTYEVERFTFYYRRSDSTLSYDEELKSFFAEMGVNWPEGSSIAYSSSLGKLTVRNTEENLEVFEELLEAFVEIPVLVHVDVEVVAFRAKDIERIRLNGGMTKEALFGLRKAGKSKRGATASAVVEPDQETVVKAVQEIIYPAEQIAKVSEDVRVVPYIFTMRETGMILQVIPKVSDNRSCITLTMRPQWVTLERWESYPAGLAAGGRHRTIPFRQPVFSVMSFETQVTVEDGDTILIGSSSPPDGE